MNALDDLRGEGLDVEGKFFSRMSFIELGSAFQRNYLKDFGSNFRLQIFTCFKANLDLVKTYNILRSIFTIVGKVLIVFMRNRFQISKNYLLEFNHFNP